MQFPYSDTKKRIPGQREIFQPRRKCSYCLKFNLFTATKKPAIFQLYAGFNRDNPHKSEDSK